MGYVIKSDGSYYTGLSGLSKWHTDVKFAKVYYCNHRAGCARARLGCGFVVSLEEQDV